MPRNGPATRRELAPDPVYRSVLVTQVVNKILSRGKRTLAERIVYTALEQVQEKSGGDPVAALKRAVENTRPEVEVKSRRVGGATYQVPVEVRPARHHPGHPLADDVLAPAPGEDDGRASRRRDPRRLEQHRRVREAPRGHAQDGGVQPRLRPLPLVVDQNPNPRTLRTLQDLSHG